MFYRQFRTLHSPIAQSDSKIPCRYHFQVTYELYACDVLFSFKMIYIYSIIFIADERLNLGKFDFNIYEVDSFGLMFFVFRDPFFSPTYEAKVLRIF